MDLGITNLLTNSPCKGEALQMKKYMFSYDPLEAFCFVLFFVSGISDIMVEGNLTPHEVHTCVCLGHAREIRKQNIYSVYIVLRCLEFGCYILQLVALAPGSDDPPRCIQIILRHVPRAFVVGRLQVWVAALLQEKLQGCLRFVKHRDRRRVPAFEVPDAGKNVQPLLQ